MYKLQPPEKGHPYLSQQPPCEILRSEDWHPVKPLLFQNLVEGSTNPIPLQPQQKGRRGAHNEVCLNLNMMTQLIGAPLFKSWKICHEIDAFDKWSRKDLIVTFTFISHKSHRWQHYHLGTFHIFIFHIRCMEHEAVYHFTIIK